MSGRTQCRFFGLLPPDPLPEHECANAGKEAYRDYCDGWCDGERLAFATCTGCSEVGNERRKALSAVRTKSA